MSDPTAVIEIQIFIQRDLDNRKRGIWYPDGWSGSFYVLEYDMESTFALLCRYFLSSRIFALSKVNYSILCTCPQCRRRHYCRFSFKRNPILTILRFEMESDFWGARQFVLSKVLFVSLYYSVLILKQSKTVTLCNFYFSNIVHVIQCWEYIWWISIKIGAKYGRFLQNKIIINYSSGVKLWTTQLMHLIY